MPTKNCPECSCHEKIGLPRKWTLRSKYFEVFGPGGPDTSGMYCSIWTPSEVFDPPIYIEWGIQYFSISSVPIKDDRTRITNLWGGKGRLR